jgi:hypothetical protein
MAVSCHEDTQTEGAIARCLQPARTEGMQAKTRGFNNGKYYDCHLDMKIQFHDTLLLNGIYFHCKISDRRQRLILELLHTINDFKWNLL